jgi:hypothetical protein
MKLLTLCFFLMVCSLAMPPQLTAQQPTFQDPLLDHFVGHWKLEGTMVGQKTVHDMDVEWVLAHQYLRIHEVARDKNSKGEPSYEAMVFIAWDQKRSEYVIAWLDDYGDISPVASLSYAKKNGNDLAFVFDDPDGPFHTTFSYDPKSDTWQMNMDATDKGQLKPFARTTLTREK